MTPFLASDKNRTATPTVVEGGPEAVSPVKGTICQLLHSLDVGGAEMLAFRLAKQLCDEYRFVFACLDELGQLGEELQRQGFHVEVLRRKSGLDAGCAIRLAQFCNRQRVDLIHAHQFTPYFYAVLPKLFWSRPPVLFTEHGRTYPDYRRRKRVIFNRIMLRRHDRVVAVGGAVKQALIDNEGFNSDRVDVVYNGVDLADFLPKPGFRESVRSELGLSDDDFAILQVARLDPVKDHGTALRTMQQLGAENPRVRLFIVGDGPERNRITSLIEEMNLAGSVTMLGTRNDVCRLLQGADCLLLTSLSEGIPVTLIEAMGATVPVIATDVGGNSEVVVHEECGLLAPAQDEKKLAASIHRLCQDNQLRDKLAKAGRKRATKLFSESSMHEGYQRHYRDILNV